MFENISREMERSFLPERRLGVKPNGCSDRKLAKKSTKAAAWRLAGLAVTRGSAQGSEVRRLPGLAPLEALQRDSVDDGGLDRAIDDIIERILDGRRRAGPGQEFLAIPSALAAAAAEEEPAMFQ